MLHKNGYEKITKQEDKPDERKKKKTKERRHSKETTRVVAPSPSQFRDGAQDNAVCTLSRVCSARNEAGSKSDERISGEALSFSISFETKIRARQWPVLLFISMHPARLPAWYYFVPPSICRRRTISLTGLIGGNYHQAAGVRAKAGANEEVDEGTSSNERFANDKCPLLEARGGRVGS